MRAARSAGDSVRSGSTWRRIAPIDEARHPPALFYDFSNAWTLTVPQQPPAPSTTGKLVA
jgi:hypothetical protein